jgi:hypothetical protein
MPFAAYVGVEDLPPTARRGLPRCCNEQSRQPHARAAQVEVEGFRSQDGGGASIDTQRLVHRLGQMECEVERLVALIERLQLGWPLLYSFDDAQTSLGGIDRAALQSLLVGGELIQVNIGDMHYVTSRSLLAYIERLVAKGVA